MPWLDTLLAVTALAFALALRPWRAAVPGWPALACWATLPLLWNADRLSQQVLVQPLAGSVLLMLMLGWPMAVLLFGAAALVLWPLGAMPAAEALQRGVWLGIVPATLALGLGAALRRWLPHQLFVYILGRGFFATAIALSAAGALAAWLHGTPPGVSAEDLVLARVLAAFGEAFITGMLVSIFVAFRPQWLATYADHIYLLPPPADDA